MSGSTSAEIGAAAWSEAQTLANQGYFIGAVGGNDTDGYLIVGMRVQGDTMPRPVTLIGQSLPTNTDNAPWTSIMWGYPTTIFEQ